MYWMYAINDEGKTLNHKGDSGSMSNAIKAAKGSVEVLPDSEPKVGYSMKVGSHYARSYSFQDWWMTTPVTEILSRTENNGVVEVIFKTRNSTYKWVDHG